MYQTEFKNLINVSISLCSVSGTAHYFNAMVCLGIVDESVYFTSPLTNTQAEAGETLVLSGELSKSGASVVWLKDYVPLDLSMGRCEVLNKDFTYQLIVPNLTVEDSGTYAFQCGDIVSAAEVVVFG